MNFKIFEIYNKFMNIKNQGVDALSQCMDESDIKSPSERKNNNIPHNKLSVWLVDKINEYDCKYNNDYYGIKSGKDNSSGEQLTYLFDMLIEAFVKKFT